MKNNKTALLVELKERLNCSENDWKFNNGKQYGHLAYMLDSTFLFLVGLDVNSKLHLLHFQSLFEELKRNQQKDLIDGKDRSMSSLSSLPLIGAGAITVLLTFGIIFLMGEMINVL